MKRSEAIQIIYDFLADPDTLINSQQLQNGENDGKIGLELQAKLCLQHLEENGLVSQYETEEVNEYGRQYRRINIGWEEE